MKIRMAFNGGEDVATWNRIKHSADIVAQWPKWKRRNAQMENKTMHYRNGREAKNGDKVIQLEHGGANVRAIGILYDAQPGNDYCNGMIASIHGAPAQGACIVDCIHYDDFIAMLKEKGLDKRPAGK